MPITPPKPEIVQLSVQRSRWTTILDTAAAVLLALTVFLLLLILATLPPEEETVCPKPNDMSLQLERLQLWKA